MPSPLLLPRFHLAARFVALSLNAFFLVCSSLLLCMSLLAFSSPPPPDISAISVSTIPEYTVTLLLLVVFGGALFLLSLLGILSLLSNSSFFLSLNILCQLGLIAAQFVTLMFIFGIRSKIHSSIVSSWSARDPTCAFAMGDPSPSQLAACRPLTRFRHSETLWYIWMAFNFCLQLSLLICSTIVCERLSYEELRKDHESRVKEPEDEDHHSTERRTPRSTTPLRSTVSSSNGN